MRTTSFWLLASGYWLLTCLAAAPAPTTNLITNPDLDAKSPDGKPLAYDLRGDVEFRYLGDPRRDNSAMGFALDSARDHNNDGKLEAAVSQTVKIDTKAGRWFEFTFRGLPENNFAVANDQLFMRVEFFSKNNPRDGKEKKLYDLVEQARRDLAANGKFKTGGGAVWQTYALKFLVPFEDVDSLKLTVGFAQGKGTTRVDSAFLMNEWKLVHSTGATPGDNIPAGANPKDQSLRGLGTAQPPEGALLPLGGRWFYWQKPGESTSTPATFDYTNADRLLYHDALYTAPFAGMMSATLRPGDKDAAGNIMEKPKLLLDNLTITFDSSAMIMHTKDIPNHPTGVFPEYPRGNPSYIQEQHATYYIPLNPAENPNHFTTTTDNSNHALPMGPIGIAVNGVVFFNPFDLGNTDATNMMDRCCGHPNQINEYHYHKYPVCINSPWADEGKCHSPLIGFAFDGYPVYGPYEKAGVMAMDIKGENALNSFNMHYDKERGWHYHVTPGKFPYLIGGYWGTEDPHDTHHGPPGGTRGPRP